MTKCKALTWSAVKGLTTLADSTNLVIYAESSSSSSGVAIRSENALFSEVNIGEDAPVGNDGDDERKQHADADEEHGVVVRAGAVPQTLLRLAVELVRRPAEMVRWVDGDADQPRQSHGGRNATTSEHCAIGGMSADVEVPADRDNGNGK